MHKLEYIKQMDTDNVTPYCQCGWIGRRCIGGRGSIYSRTIALREAQDQFVDHLRELNDLSGEEVELDSI